MSTSDTIQTEDYRNQFSGDTGDDPEYCGEPETVSAFCDCCPAQASGTREHLEFNGWELHSMAQFCPDCGGI